jgi:hypothetical protein
MQGSHRRKSYRDRPSLFVGKEEDTFYSVGSEKPAIYDTFPAESL